MPALPDRQRVGSSVQRGFFLIEAMVAILIFALGILGLVAMGGTAVSSQSDAQYRTEASSLADAIAAQIALGIVRTDDASKALSLSNFAHQPNPPPTTSPAPCSFTGTALTSGSARLRGCVSRTTSRIVSLCSSKTRSKARLGSAERSLACRSAARSSALALRGSRYLPPELVPASTKGSCFRAASLPKVKAAAVRTSRTTPQVRTP